ncbi:MAG: hypothetical protein GSR81_02810 [Desulfurococcales archaeon]|nr:hypothetical protein [Desulfurococcales archaeon]
MPYADCRKCIYFIPIDELTDVYRKELALVLEAKWGWKVLGWCKAREKPITYYEGFCRRYKPRPSNVRSLTEFFQNQR